MSQLHCGLKSWGGAGICIFPAETPNFRQKRLVLKFLFCPSVPAKWGTFSPESCVFVRTLFNKKKTEIKQGGEFFFQDAIVVGIMY